MRQAFLRAICVAVGVAGFSSSARAETYPSLSTFGPRPSLEANGGIVLERLVPNERWAFDAGLWAMYGWNVVTLPKVTPVVPVINARLASVATANLGLARWLGVGVSVPLVLAQSGNYGLGSGVVAGGQVPTSALGDIGVHMKYTPFSNENGGYGLALLGIATLPTGDRASFVGEGAMTAGARVIGDVSFIVASIQASVGFMGRPNPRTWPNPQKLGSLRYGSEIPWSLGVLVHPSIVSRHVDKANRHTIEVALRGSVPAYPAAPFSRGSLPLSAASVLTADHIVLGHGLVLSVGVDFSLIAVPTAQLPAFSAFLGLRWGAQRRAPEKDVPPDLKSIPKIEDPG